MIIVYIKCFSIAATKHSFFYLPASMGIRVVVLLVLSVCLLVAVSTLTETLENDGSVIDHQTGRFNVVGRLLPSLVVSAPSSHSG